MYVQFTTSVYGVHVDFITKDCKDHYKVGQVKVGYVLQIGTGFAMRDNFHLKVGQ